MSYNKCIEIANKIYSNIDEISEEENMKIFLNNSENIINKYIEMFPLLTYHQVISIYISLTLMFYINF
jgi:hypothetical protein